MSFLDDCLKEESAVGTDLPTKNIVPPEFHLMNPWVAGVAVLGILGLGYALVRPMPELDHERALRMSTEEWEAALERGEMY